MKGDPDFVILKYHAWPDAKLETSLLGAIVKEPLRPTNNYVPASPLRYTNEELSEGSLTDFVLANSARDGTEVGARLRSIASLNFHAEVSDAINLSGKFVRYKRLQQIDDFWHALVQNSAVQTKVPRWISPFKPPPCLVVGIMICDDVEISFSGEASRDVGGQVELPIGAIALAASVPDPTGGAVNPEASAHAAHRTVTMFKAKSGQSRIFALELQKVTTKGVLQKRLELGQSGPVFDPVRLAGGSARNRSAEDQPITVDELIRDELTAEEYAGMTD